MYEWRSSPSSPLILSSSNPVASVFAAATAQGSASTFILTVTSFLDPQREASQASVVVSVISALAPLVNIHATPSKINSNQLLSMAGNISFISTNKGVVWWTVDDLSLNMSMISLSAWRYEVTKQAVVNLVIAPNSFSPSSKLTFTIHASAIINGRTYSTNASTIISVNSIPLPGFFTITPSSGVELTTSFSLTALYWHDTDLPLSFEFGFVSPSHGIAMVVSPRSISSAATTTLPAGSAITDFAVNCFANIFDIYGANNSAIDVAKVTKGGITSTQLLAIGSQISSANIQPAQAQQILSTLTAVLNSIDCSSSPKCTALNRYPCSSLANTCGACLNGFIGESGDSNQKCLLESAVRAVTSGGCKTDCNAWQYCNSNTRICTAKAKQCVVDGCSGHGACTYESASTGFRLTMCVQGDSSCVAKCLCLHGYFGAACTMNQTQIESAQSIRATLVTGLASLMQQQNTDAQSVRSWASSLNAIAAVPQEVSSATASSIMRMSLAIIDAAASTPESALAVAASAEAAIDNAQVALSSGRNSTGRSLFVSPSPYSPFLGAVEAVGRLVSSQLVPGQGVVSSVQNTFRSVSYSPAISAGSANRINISLPLSPADGRIAKSTVISLPISFGKMNAVNVLSLKVIQIMCANICYDYFRIILAGKC